VPGFIRFSENERRIIDHRLFRRLRFIRQLALTEFVYPGATHTRFEHSLGVMEVATRAFDRLAALRGNLLETSFREVQELRDRPLAVARQIIRLAALLHDVGHACFSHAAEPLIHGEAGHEGLSWRIIEEQGFLESDLNRNFFDGCARLLAKVLRGGPQMPPQLQILRDLVSGEMDADRSDYLLRDSLHCGVEYGRFDYRRMIECLDLHQGPGGTLEVALQRDGIHIFEALILARYQMNTQVYYHRVRRIYDYYLRRYFEAKGPEFLNTPEKILAHNDITMMATMLRDAEEGTDTAAPWAQRIRDRRHHRVIHETGEDANAMDLRNSNKVYEKLQVKFPDLEFYWDKPARPVSIHKLLVPEDTEETGKVIVPLIGPRGEISYVGERSHILRRVPLPKW
jgi:HD superfamily phosphohydrolase